FRIGLFLFLGTFISLSLQGRAQGLLAEPAGTKVIISIPNPSIVSAWNILTGVPTFSIPAINTLFSAYGVSYCTKAFPHSRFPHILKMYRVTCTDTNLIHALHTAYPQYFPRGYVHLELMPSAYYP